MENYVIGSKLKDNKQSGNREKISASSMKGSISGNQKPTVLRTQNSAPSTPPMIDANKGDKGIQTQAKRQKKIIRSGTSYDDRSIKAAMSARGMS